MVLRDTKQAEVALLPKQRSSTPPVNCCTTMDQGRTHQPDHPARRERDRLMIYGKRSTSLTRRDALTLLAGNLARASENPPFSATLTDIASQAGLTEPV